MKQRKGISDFAHSAPEFLIQYMDRHRDRAWIVCLVGGRRPDVHLDEQALLACDRDGAAAAYQSFKVRYPIVITRDLDKAKGWIRARARQRAVRPARFLEGDATEALCDRHPRQRRPGAVVPERPE